VVRRQIPLELFQVILTVIIIVTAGGWCLDWIFSGTFDPIYVKDKEDEREYREFSITCHVCGEQGTFSLPVESTSKEVKCKRCGSFLSEKE
jgi:ribosomal protein S27E